MAVVAVSWHLLKSVEYLTNGTETLYDWAKCGKSEPTLENLNLLTFPNANNSPTSPILKNTRRMETKFICASCLTENCHGVHMLNTYEYHKTYNFGPCLLQATN